MNLKEEQQNQIVRNLEKKHEREMEEFREQVKALQAQLEENRSA